MMHTRLVAFIVCAFWLVVATVINLGATKIVQWTIESIVERTAPFALLFASLIVLPFALVSTAACAASMLKTRR